MWDPSSSKIFFVQLICWISIPLVIWLGPTWMLLTIAFYILYSGIGISLTFHRTISHNSFKFKESIRNALIVLGSFANNGSVLTWTAIHRAHHKHCDTIKDPHSPRFKSPWFVIFGSMFAEVDLRHARDLLRDPFVMITHKYYYLIQLPWILLLFLLGGWKAVIACHFAPGGLAWLLGGLVNWLNHLYGYRTYAVKDTSTNNVLTGFLVLGEGWHNNHHQSPIAATTKRSKYEIDIVYYMGRLLGGIPK